MSARLLGGLLLAGAHVDRRGQRALAARARRCGGHAGLRGRLDLVEGARLADACAAPRAACDARAIDVPPKDSTPADLRRRRQTVNRSALRRSPCTTIVSPSLNPPLLRRCRCRSRPRRRSRGQAALLVRRRASKRASGAPRSSMKLGAPPALVGLPFLSRIVAVGRRPQPSAVATSGERLHLVEHRRRDRRRRAVGRSSNVLLRRDRDVGALVGRVEDLVEGRVDRVGEDVGARRSAPRRARRPAPSARGAACGRRARAGRPCACQPAAFMRSRTPSARPGLAVVDDACRRRARRSGRRTPRPAASWVTMMTVWPKSSTERRSRLEHLGRGLRVEVAGRLVGEHDRRAATRARARRRRAAAGRRRARTGGASRRSREADRVDEPVDPLLVGLAAGDRQRQHDVLPRVEDRQQVEGLEDEADLVAAQLGQRACRRGRRARRRRRRPSPLVGRSRPASRCMSVDLPEPEGPMIAVKRPAGKSDRDAVERVDLGLPLAVDAASGRWRRRGGLRWSERDGEGVAMRQSVARTPGRRGAASRTRP